MGGRRASSGRVVSGGNGERLIGAGSWGVWQHVVGWEVRVASGGGMIMCIRGVRWIGEYICSVLVLVRMFSGVWV